MVPNSRRKRSQWNYHTDPIVELCPWLSGAVLQCPGFLPFFMNLLQVLVCSCIAIFLFKTQATSGTKFRSKYLKIRFNGHYPSGITMLEQPLAAWGSAAVPWHFALFMHVPAVICFFCISYIFLAIYFCTIW